MSDPGKTTKYTGRIRVGAGRCPKGHSLMSEEVLFNGEKAVALEVRLAGKSGMIYLNPFYGIFEFRSGLDLSKGDVVELFCPECETSLTIDEMCKLCNIPMTAIHLPDGGQVEICPKVGCHNHALKIVDLDEQLQRMYVEETKIQM
jgi:hypothetical protein